MLASTPDCPRCRVPMVRGSFSEERTGGGYTSPLEAPRLVFRDSFGNRITALDWNGGAPDGYRCGLCSASLILPS